MLRTLALKNLLLIDEANVNFENGLTVITGETGAGKTALIEAIRLILGERADASKVRKGALKAHIQASFDGDHLVDLIPIFTENGIPFSDDEPLIISREISNDGKSRAFVCGTIVPLSFLSKIAPHLVEFIGQHAQILLKQSDRQRHFLDLYAGLDLTSFQTLWKREKNLIQTLESLQTKRNLSNFQTVEKELQELESLGFFHGEDDALFEEFSLLANSKEISEKSMEVIEDADCAMALCGRLQNHLEKLPLPEGSAMAKEAHLQLHELKRLAQSLSAKMDSHPSRLIFLEERLKAIESFQRKFGKDLEHAYRELKQKYEEFNQLDDQIQFLKKTLIETKKQTDIQVQHLSRARQEAALLLALELTSGLRELNIDAAEVAITLEKTQRSQSGEDLVTFMLRANKGEKIGPVKDCSSGGEISRLLFCLQLALSKKRGTKTLIFDEIDANVGGKTALLIGEKLRELSKGSQILCVTHFPQVARFGTHHIRVYKRESGDRTLCFIENLSEDKRELEFLRMIGGAATNAPAEL